MPYQRPGRAKRPAPQADINERPPQRHRLNAVVDGADNQGGAVEGAEGAAGGDEEEEGDRPPRNRGLGQGFAANRGEEDGDSGDDGELDDEDPEDDVRPLQYLSSCLRTHYSPQRNKEVARIMRQIQNRWPCLSKRPCGSDICWINADSEHVPLKIPHLRVWTEAIVRRITFP
jgi:hypothetical protein